MWIVELPNDYVIILTPETMLFATLATSQGPVEGRMRFPLPFGHIERYSSLFPLQLEAVIYVSSCHWNMLLLHPLSTKTFLTKSSFSLSLVMG